MPFRWYKLVLVYIFSLPNDINFIFTAFRVILRSYNLEPGNMENFSGSSDDDIDPDDYHDIDVRIKYVITKTRIDYFYYYLM